jgi:hypothetical protein
MQFERRIKCRPHSIDEAGEALINNPHYKYLMFQQFIYFITFIGETPTELFPNFSCDVKCMKKERVNFCWILLRYGVFIPIVGLKIEIPSFIMGGFILKQEQHLFSYLEIIPILRS